MKTFIALLLCLLTAPAFAGHGVAVQQVRVRQPRQRVVVQRQVVRQQVVVPHVQQFRVQQLAVPVYAAPVQQFNAGCHGGLQLNAGGCQALFAH